MIDYGFKFNWREPAPNSPEMQRALSAGRQQADMGGYRPLPNMQGYTPNMQMSTDVTPGVVSKNTPPRELNQQGGFRSPTGVGMVNTGTGMDYTNREARKEELMAKYKENEDKIVQLKQEYQKLQQEESTASENLERDIAANRAGIGDSSQYNTWRAREESRAAQDKAREEDKKGKLSTLKSKVNGALLDLSYARGGKQEATARKIYQDALRDYREAGGLDEFNSDGVSSTTTLFDTKNFIRQHRNKNGNWDSEENKQEAISMAKSLGDEGASLLDEIYYQSTQGKVDSNAAAFKNAVKKELQKIDMTVHGEGDVVPIEVNGKSYDAKIVGNANGKGYHFVVNGKTYTL